MMLQPAKIFSLGRALCPEVQIDITLLHETDRF